MNSIYYVNLVLLIVDMFGFTLIATTFVFFTKTYYNYQVPKINSYNDVISTKQIDLIINQFKLMYNFHDYQVSYINTPKYIRTFRNINKKTKQIIISKKIFESVGYEIDYIISRLWISAKKIEKNNLVGLYKFLLTFFPILIITLMVFSLSFNVFLFVYMSGDPTAEVGNSKILLWLWKFPIISFLFVFLFAMLILNYYMSMRVKELLELEYNNEVIGIVKIVINEYMQDFGAARTYAQGIKISYIPLYKRSDFWETSKWLGPFVYL